MGMSDAQYKDVLRRDLRTFEHLKELIASNKQEELMKEVEEEIKRINSSLQD